MQFETVSHHKNSLGARQNRRDVNRLALWDINIFFKVEYEKWAGQIRDAIKYLHGKGLVWSDAKAANVLIDEDGNAVLICIILGEGVCRC